MRDFVKSLFLFSTLLCLFISSRGLAWDKELAIGAGYGKEIGQRYDNYGLAISGKFLKHRIDNTLFATLDGTLAYWRAQTSTDDVLTTAAISAALRAYFANPDFHVYRPYLGASIGPALLSSRYFGTRVQGANFAFQITLEGGIEVKNIDINLHLAHYCNAGLFDPNQAINIPFVLSIGYLF